MNEFFEELVKRACYYEQFEFFRKGREVQRVETTAEY